MTCQDWVNTKAACRFLDNDRVQENVILEGYFQVARDRVRTTSGPVLILHNTTTFSFQRDNAFSVGITHKSFVGKDAQGRPMSRTICGLLMHSRLAVTLEGLPNGLVAVKFWNRQQFKGCSALTLARPPCRATPSFGRDSLALLKLNLDLSLR